MKILLIATLLVLSEPTLQSNPPALVQHNVAKVAPATVKRAIRFHGIVPKMKIWCDQYGHWWFERKGKRCDLLKYRNRRGNKT